MTETRICQNCKKEFVIESDDFQFYEKIKVPPPTWCPECRLMRRFAFRNERVLYRRKCDLCGENIVSRYDASVSFPVFCSSCWWSDRWDPFSYGQKYDFSVPFFAQYRELSKKVPRPSLAVTNAVNSDYANQCLDIKNVYLSTSVIRGENIYYSTRVDDSRDVFDVSYGRKIERCAHATDLTNCATTFFSRYAKNTIDSLLLYDVRNASHCTACVNLRGGRYHIFNKSYRQDEYERELKRYDIGSYRNLSALQEKFKEFAARYPRRYAMLEQCVNVIGDNTQNAKNCRYVFDSYNMENCKYMFAVIDGSKDSYDLAFSGVGAELCYESTSCIGYGNKFSYYPYGQYMEYCELTPGKAATHFFGCISITAKKDYCIFNVSYTKDEYESLVTRIRKHMNDMPYIDSLGKVYRYGEFFPVELSTFAYNETVAQEHFPLDKEMALKNGYRWKDPKERSYTITIRASQLPDHIKDASDTVVNEVVECEHGGTCDEGCTTAFRILPAELEFCRAINIPLPRRCPNCRYFRRFKQRNPIKLWHRQCMCDYKVYANTAKHAHHPEGRCSNEFETSYAPDRPEIVYCESCYNSEVV